MTPAAPFVSVIVPVYNKGPHVARALNSALHQTFPDFELIVVCDPSTDESTDVVRSFTDPRIRVFSRDEPGPGGYAARNLGIAQARAPWVAFLDADDEWYSHHLQETHAAAARDPRIELISSGWIAQHGAVATPSSYFRARQARGSHYFGVADYIGRHGRPICTGVLRARTDLLKRVGGFDSRWAHGADVRCWLDLVINLRGKAFWVASVTSIYHTDSVNMVSHGRRQRVSPTTELVRRYAAENAPQIRPFRSKLIRYANDRAMLPFLHALKPGDLAPRNLARTFIFSVRDPLLPFRLLLYSAYRRLRRRRP